MSTDPHRDAGPQAGDASSKRRPEPAAQNPEEQAQGESQIEAFGEEGAGIAAKE